jgi:hypothetical protein
VSGDGSSALRTVVVADDGGPVRLDLPEGWVVAPEVPVATPEWPVVAQPEVWDGEPPAVVVSRQRDGLQGARLGAVVTHVAATRLEDPVVVDVAVHDAGDVEIVVAHRSRGVDVTTVEHHHCRPDGTRWVVGFTAADADLVDLAPVVPRVVGSLRVEPRS